MKANRAAVLMGAALLALSAQTLYAATPEQRSADQSAPPAQLTSQELDQMWARMKLMHQQMTRILQARTPSQRAGLLREHMQTMLEQMQAMRAMGGSMMSSMMGSGMMRGGMMRGRGMAGGGMMGGGMMSQGGAQSAASAGPIERMQDRLDMMQMMMEQMMGQMQGMESLGAGKPHK